MSVGISGGLVSRSFIRTDLAALKGAEPPDQRVRAALLQWQADISERLGPASTARAIADTALAPLMRLLGFELSARQGGRELTCGIAASAGVSLPVLIVPWGCSLDMIRQTSIEAAAGLDARWCVNFNGTTFRVIDSHAPWSRKRLNFDLSVVVHEPEVLAAFWTLMRADALRGSDPLLDRAVDLSAKQGVVVCKALGLGVLDALKELLQALVTGAPPDLLRLSRGVLLDQALTVLYRIVFLLFAEARALVPIWHPVYRDRYTIDGILTGLMAGRKRRGIWLAIQAISRLAHAGCRAGELRVTPFNGRLFSPAHAPTAERGRIGDDAISRALLAVSTTPGAAGRRGERILYHDLDVEQLGAVYEHVLDYEARVERCGQARRTPTVALVRTGDTRKASGSFYTPRSMTDWLVRHTLEPLVRGRTADEILSLRVVDAAMGSGAFLVAACRHLASSIEMALIRDGQWHASEVTREDRVGLRREVAQRCLYGVDINPMAVQLARLSLWLATLAGDRPLTFLDHNLVVGDSLVGVSVDDVARQPPRPGKIRHARLPLFDTERFRTMVSAALPDRLWIAREPDDDVASVRRKESLLAAIHHSEGAWARWRSVLDLWCACWFWPDDAPPDSALYGDLVQRLLHGSSALPVASAQRWIAVAAATARASAFLHWELTFPEVFFDEKGRRRHDAGFDAVIGNPPWDVVRGDSGDARTRDQRRAAARQLVSFVHGAGVYATVTRSHLNRYQLFVERALQLTRTGGRVGLVLPSGILSDTGSGPLRRHLFEHAAVDRVVGLDNRAGLFPIHRSLRFVLMTASAGGHTDRIACRFGLTNPDTLDASDGTSLEITRALVERLSGPADLGIPEVSSPVDLRLLEHISANVPALGSADGWNAHFGRELNASDDRGAFVPRTRAPHARVVLEGKHIEPFRAHAEEAAMELAREAIATTKVPTRARLAYRDVSSATNKLTLIAAIVPARAVTTHTLFVLRDALPLERQLLLSALLNSYVANYLVRMRVHTHVTSALMARLPVPFSPDTDPIAPHLVQLSTALTKGRVPPEKMPEYAEIQALVARLYGLSEDQFRHVLSTFPLVSLDVKDAALRMFESLA